MYSGSEILLSARSLRRKSRRNFGDAGVFHQREFVSGECRGRVLRRVSSGFARALALLDQFPKFARLPELIVFRHRQFGTE